VRVGSRQSASKTRVNALMPRPYRSENQKEKMDMGDTLQALLDSGVLYLALGAVICVVLGVGAARRLFQGANKIKTPK
jgi:hypothetical protein